MAGGEPQEAVQSSWIAQKECKLDYEAVGLASAAIVGPRDGQQWPLTVPALPARACCWQSL